MLTAQQSRLNAMAPAGALGRVLKTLAEWRDRVFPAADRLRERYLSAAVDRVDLEQRLRTLERRPAPFGDCV
jgi:hypothetical protein